MAIFNSYVSLPEGRVSKIGHGTSLRKKRSPRSLSKVWPERPDGPPIIGILDMDGFVIGFTFW
jgi:hypothetical protein